MPSVKLTQRFIDSLRAPHPSGRQLLYFDTVTRGFGVQVSGTTGAIDYVAQRDLPSKVEGARKQTRRVNIGPVGAKHLRLEAARQRAEEELDKVRRGIDPRAKERPGAMFTLRQAKEQYFIVKKLSKGSKRSKRVYGHLDLDATVQPCTDRPVDLDDAIARHIHRIDAWIDQITRAKAKAG